LKFTVKFKKAPLPDCTDPSESIPFISSDGDTEVTGVWPNFVIKNLPIGRTWVRYYVEDKCGNVNFMTTEVDVVDRIAPVAVCDEFTVVTLSNNGWAHVFAESFDDGSHDNCSDVTFDVRRMTPGCGASTTEWGPFVQICCDDVGREVMVELRVTDASGNRNTCMVIVDAQDKVPPFITCPPNVTINCGSDTSAIVLGKPVFSSVPLSVPYYTDNCPNPTLTWQNFGTIDNCGQGVITRRFRVTDRGGRTATCDQTITLRNNNPYTGPLPAPQGWPANVELSGCINIDTDPSKTGVPFLGNGPCSLVAYTYEDQVFPFVEGVCYKILRKWTVIDWCKFAPNRDVNGNLYPGVPTQGINMWQYTQIIKVTDHVKPVLSTCSKSPTDAFGENCTGFVELRNSATDCTPSSLLKWKYVIDLDNDDIGPFINGATNDASGNYPVGTHRITWTVEDQCGNQSTCTYLFEVRDRKKPTPYCLSDITTVIMPSSGNVTIWAIDFNLGSFDNCPGTLRYSLSSNINEISRTYTCSQLGQNTVTLYVWDVAGNFDFCTVTINIQANGTACSGARLAGTVGTDQNEMVKDVQVVLQNMHSNETMSIMTNTQGLYEFAGMPESVTYKITPDKDIDHLNGVSTLDLVLIQRHILGMDKFNSAYKYLAGDVTKDNKVTAADLVELRKLILGIYTKFPNNKSWRFIDKAINISDIANPWDADEYISINNFNASVMNNNFVAVKVGDINGSATTNANEPSVEHRNNKVLNLNAENKSFYAGELIKLEIKSDNFSNISGAQWTMNFDAASLDYQNIIPGALKMNVENVNALQAKNGKLAFSWNESNAKSVSKDNVLFTIEFRATANNTISKTINISSDITRAEAYTNDLSELKVNLEFRNGSADEDAFDLEQNNPNPFTLSTLISFTLPQAAQAKLTIYDITGKVVKTIKNEYPKGRSEITITTEDINAQGVLFYELESNGQKATKKMIYLNK
ncbi:MAG: T9SS type A sorting domain-containing protein, partial [Saprospiraceae bacterium]|nr:T9SS type A sorting domain-containing protein [Saprospiraceae bacterium]